MKVANGRVPTTKAAYRQFVKERTPGKPILKNAIRAFFVGGAICVIGQLIQMMYAKYLGFDAKSAANPTVATLIFLSAVLTGLGVYDRMGQWAGAGTAVPVTGFANSVASAAIEHRSEGYVLGVGTKMFKVAGPVIVYGVVSAFVVAIIRLLFDRLLQH